jgi:hypothetical protein
VNSRLTLVAIACLAPSLIFSFACSDNPLKPSTPGAGETVYTLPTASGTPPITFSFNLSRLQPARGGQLSPGAEVQITVRCSKPSGWEMLARIRAVEGPGGPAIAAPMFDNRASVDRRTNERGDNFILGSCEIHDQGTAYQITAQEPNIPYIRLEAWAHPTSNAGREWRAGSEPGFGYLVSPSGTQQAPGVIAFERVDWRKP